MSAGPLLWTRALQHGKEIMLNVTAPQNPMILPGFILAAMLSGVAISQLYIILEYLRTDC